MSEQTSQEPTMEEILASIRRIISEDDAPAGEEGEAAPAVEGLADVVQFDQRRGHERTLGQQRIQR